MTTTASLIEEARKLDAEVTEKPWEAVPKRAQAAAAEWALRCRPLLPQLTDALVAAASVAEVEATLRGQIVAYHAKVRALAIPEAPDGAGTPRIRCRLCGGVWFKGQDETHQVPDCPARPVEG